MRPPDEAESIMPVSCGGSLDGNGQDGPSSVVSVSTVHVGTAAAKEVMVARQDRNVEGEGKCDRCPVVGVSGHPSARRTLQVLIERPGYDLDHVVLDEVVNDPEQLLALPARQAPLADDGSDTLLQLMPRLLPLLLGNYTLEVRMGEQLPTAPTKQLRHEHARIDDNDHSGSARRRSNSWASSSSVMPVSSRISSTERPSRSMARLACSRSPSTGM